MLYAGIITAFALCFCIYNYWFQKERFRRLLDHEKTRVNRANRPGAWLAYAVTLFVMLLVEISFVIMQYYKTLFEQIGR